MIKALLDGLGDLIFPHNCILCSQYVPNRSNPQLCSSCLAAIEFNEPPFCLRCSRHLKIYTAEGLCPACIKYPIQFDHAWGAVTYSDDVQRLLHLFKYHQRTSVRKIFRHFMGEFSGRYRMPLDMFDYGLPIPLHPVRLRERGFNQSQLIAQILNEDHGLPIIENTLSRIRPTHPQSFLGQKERWTNMEGAFKIKNHFSVNNSSILLIDDLLTTGATASAAAQTLKEAGAKHVGLFVVALTPSPTGGKEDILNIPARSNYANPS